MPLSRNTKWYAIQDAKMAAVTADPEGGSPTFGTLFDVPGMKTLGLTGDVTSVQLRGDNQALDQNSILSGLTVAFEHAKISLDVLNIMLGYAITESGTTPAQKTIADLTAANALLKPFYLEAATPTGGTTIGGDGHMVFWKCVLTKFPEMGFAEEGYKTVSGEAAVIPMASNGRWHRIALNETATSIATVAA